MPESHLQQSSFLMYQRGACYCDRHSFSWDEIKTFTLKLRLTSAVKDSTLTVISYRLALGSAEPDAAATVDVRHMIQFVEAGGSPRVYDWHRLENQICSEMAH